MSNLERYDMGVFHHFGVPVSTKQDDEIYIEGGKVFITDAESHPYRVEYLRFEKDSPMHEDVINNCHAAFMVDEISITGQETDGAESRRLRRHDSRMRRCWRASVSRIHSPLRSRIRAS